jgi:hypothetical protein
LESVIARLSEPLPATLLSSRLVTLKTAGTRRSSKASSRGWNFRARAPVGRPRVLDVLVPVDQERTLEHHMAVSPYRIEEIVFTFTLL